MPYLTLTLDGQLVDLPPDAAVALSYRANDLRNLESREAAFSESFTLPLTARNVAALGTPHALDSQTLAPYRLLPAVLTSPGGTVLLRGFGILDASADGYELTLTDAVGSLFAQVGDAPLRALDLSAYDHTYSLATTQAAQGRATGYTYVLADDGRLTTRDPALGVLWHELVQVVPYRTVLEAIVAAGLPGYRLSGSLLTEPAFVAAVFPRATPTPQLRESARTPYAVKALRSAPVREHDAGTGAYYPLIPFPQQLTGDTSRFDGTRFTTPPYPCDIRVSARLLVRADDEFVPSIVARVVAAVRVADVTGSDAVSVYEHIVAAGLGSLYQGLVAQQPPGLRAVEFDFTLPAFAASRKLALQLRLENGGGLTIGPGSTLSFSIGARTYPGAPVHLDASLPDISQADALKLLSNQFNLIWQADAEAKVLRVDCFNDLERNRARAVDWSDRLDAAARPRLAYRLGEYAQRNVFTYDDAPAAYDELLLGAPDALGPGRGLLRVPNQTLPVTADAYAAPVTLPLPHAALGGALSLLWLPQVAPGEASTAPKPYDPATAYTKDSPQVLYGAQRWQCTLGLGATVPGTPPQLGLVPTKPLPIGSTVSAVAWAVAAEQVVNDELPTCALRVPAPAAPGLRARADAPDTAAFTPAEALSRDGLGFDALLGSYHEGLRRALGRARVLTVALRLRPTDIAALDFAVPVRLNIAHVPGYGALRGLFYLNDIDQYTPGQPGAVQVTLLALGDQVPGLAPAVTVPILPPAGTPRRALLLESGAPVLLEAGGPILLEP